MKNTFFSILAAATTLAGTVSASWGISGATSGVDKTTGARPFRLSIEELQTSGPMWDLYIQAHQFWQSIDQENMFSWYGVSGIHGLPNIPWDDAEGGGYYVGYCTHGSILFPVWHRPYMALHEQIISIFAHEIADTYPNSTRATYQAAADQLRIPYWDWSTNATIPEIVNTPRISINTAWGASTIDNPLYRYNYHPYNSTAMDGIYSGANWTVRAPDNQTQSQPFKSDQQLMSNQQQFHDGMYQLFSSQPEYAMFSNTGAVTNQTGYQNLENLHNIVHDTIGGTMAYLWVAAMDPIFFLHHANVDRMFSIWQAIYPDSFVIPQNNVLGTYTLKPNSSEDANSPLTPFHSDNNGTFFTANTVRDIKSFGYAYREIVDWNVTASRLTQNAKKAVNQIYNPSGSQASKRAINHKRDVSNINMQSANAAAQQYALNIKADKSKINSTMLIHFQLRNSTFGSFAINMGDTSNNPASSFATPGPQAGQITLTHALLSAGANLADVNGTLSMIAKEMSWAGETPSGRRVLPTDFENGAIQIQVSTRSVSQTEPEDEFPAYGNWNELAASNLGTVASKLIGDAVNSIANSVESALEGVL